MIFQIKVDSTWGGNCSINQICQQAKQGIIPKVQNLLDDKCISIVKNPKVIKVIIEES